MTRRTLLTLLCVACGCRGGCGGTAPAGSSRAPVLVATVDGGADPGEQEAPRAGGTVRIHVDNEPPTLNPLVEHDYWTSWIALGPVYEPLLRQDPASGRPLPSLATAWSEGPSGLRLSLRAGVRWHDGRPLVVEDVVETFRRLREPGATPDARASLAGVRAVEPDPSAPTTAVRFLLDQPAPLLLQALSRIPILPAHRFTAGDLRPQPDSRAPVGTGPFRFVEWKAGSAIVLARSADYWGTPAHLDRVELRVVRDREAAFELFRRGELDLLWQLTPSQVDRALAGGLPEGARLLPWYLPRYAFVVWNTKRPPLDDVRVRRALAHLVDRERYLRTVYRGRARSVTGPYLPGSEGYDETVAPWPFDPARADALLDEAGLRDRDGDGLREGKDGQPLRLAFLLTAHSVTVEPLATRMQEDLRRAGVALDIVPVEWAQLLDRLRHHAFDVSALMWTDVTPLQDNAPFFHSSQAVGGQNYGAWSSAEADRLLAALAVTPPGPARAALDHQLHRLVAAEQPYTFLGSPEVDSLVAARLHGYHPGADGPGLARLWVDPAPTAAP